MSLLMLYLMEKLKLKTELLVVVVVESTIKMNSKLMHNIEIILPLNFFTHFLYFFWFTFVTLASNTVKSPYNCRIPSENKLCVNKLSPVSHHINYSK